MAGSLERAASSSSLSPFVADADRLQRGRRRSPENSLSAAANVWRLGLLSSAYDGTRPCEMQEVDEEGQDAQEGGGHQPGRDGT